MDLHIIMHIPKTGGQTIRNHLREHLPLNEAFAHIGPFGDRYARENGLTRWIERSDAERAQVRVLAGHDLSIHTPALVPGTRNVKLVGMFREPAARMVSHYNFTCQFKFAKDGKTPPDWGRWYGGMQRNFISRWIKQKFLARPFDAAQSDEALFDEIVSELERFWMLGTMAHFDAFAARLYADVGVPPSSQAPSNVGGRSYPILLSMNPEIEAQVRGDHPVDCAIFDWVQARAEAAFGPERVKRA